MITNSVTECLLFSKLTQIFNLTTEFFIKQKDYKSNILYCKPLKMKSYIEEEVCIVYMISGEIMIYLNTQNLKRQGYLSERIALYNNVKSSHGLFFSKEELIDQEFTRVKFNFISSKQKLNKLDIPKITQVN